MLEANYSNAVEQQWRMAGYLLFGHAKQRMAEADLPPEGILSVMNNPNHTRTILADQLLSADPFYWSPSLCKMLEQTAPDIPEWTLTLDTMIADKGFAWFERPLAMPPFTDGNRYPLAAFSWSPVFQYVNPSLKEPVLFDGPPGKPEQMWLVLTFFVLYQGRVEPLGMTSIYHGECLTQLLPKRDAEGMPREWVARTARYVATAFSFLEQEILIAPSEIPVRATRKRKPPFARQDPVVRVVQLRRRHREAEGQGERADVEWSCQWLVRGHWRQQWYPNQNAHKPKWIMPYTKGPDDKPLKPPAKTIFAVTR